MLKIRMQGTKKDLHWFRRLLKRQEDVDVKSVSEPFANKGTGPEFCKKQQNSGSLLCGNKYFRMYAEVEKTGK